MRVRSNLAEIRKRRGISAADLAASLHASIAARVVGLAKRLSVEDEVVLTGGY